jgi:hypothetical protein
MNLAAAAAAGRTGKDKGDATLNAPATTKMVKMEDDLLQNNLGKMMMKKKRPMTMQQQQPKGRWMGGREGGDDLVPCPHPLPTQAPRKTKNGTLQCNPFS